MSRRGWDVPGYSRVRVLGSGGFGEVVLARHDASGTMVAIKYLHQELLADPEFAAMFRAEAAVLASLDDRNVVRLYEYLESPAGAAIVMELVDGVSLREILSRQGQTTAEAALVVLQGSLLGLAAAHARGVVHRDYKPANVLVNGAGESKLTDFGIAARAGDRPVPAGTLAYAPPEQLGGSPASPAGDVYAATVTFYECLAGRPPFTGNSVERVLYQQIYEPVPLEPVPEPLRPLMAAGLARDPAHRPADATALVTTLRTVAASTYGEDWEERGRSRLAAVALLLAALWPSGGAPAVAGSAVEQVHLARPHPGPARKAHSGQAKESRHLKHLRHLAHLRHLRVLLAITAVAAVATVGLVIAAPWKSPSPSLSGTWTGTYYCSQGKTGLRLAMQASSAGRINATFNFYAVPSNPGVPSGSYAMTGSYSAKGVVLTPDHWIREPSGYEMVGLNGRFAPGNQNALEGQVTTAGCGTFSVTKS